MVAAEQCSLALGVSATRGPDDVCLAGGAGEGKQHLRPDGAIKNQHQVKTDAALPAYCTPPNPCPNGYTGQWLSILPCSTC